MKWPFYEKGNAIIVEMNSRKGNVHNPNFVDDFHVTLDEIDKTYPRHPLIITAQGPIFCAGIDLEYASSLFAEGNPKKLWDWYKKYSGMMVHLNLALTKSLLASLCRVFTRKSYAFVWVAPQPVRQFYRVKLTALRKL